MKLRAVTMNDVRQFTRPVRVTGIGDGLNVLTAPNEAGKSTLFDAIHAAFFIPHRSTLIRDLKPAVGGNPEITLDLEHEGATLRVVKRWGRGALAEVWRDGRLIARADEAEALIAGLTHPPSEGGPAGLLWVRQGLTALDDDTDKKRAQATLKSRRDLMSSVTGEFEALTGGKRMDRALARARDEHDRLMTQRGPRAGGPLDEAVKAVEALATQATALGDKAARLRAALDERRGRRRALAEVSHPDDVSARQAALAGASAAFGAAERHAALLSGASAALNAADLARAGVRRDILARGQAAQALAALGLKLAVAGDAAQTAAVRDTAAQSARATAETAQAAARDARRAAEARVQAALRAEARRAGAERRGRLDEALTQARALVTALPALRQAAATGPDAAQLAAIDAAAQDLAIAEGLAQAAAPRVSVDYLRADAPRVTRAGVALDATPRPLTEVVVLNLPGIGALRIEPGAGDAPGRLAQARAALAQTLATASVDTPEAARTAARARTEAGRILAEAQATLRRLAPEGVDALAAEVARLAPAPDADDAADPATAQTCAETAAQAETLADAAASEARVRAEAARESAITARHAHETLAARRTEAVAALAALADAATLDQALAAAETAHGQAAAQHATLADGAPDLEAARVALNRARSVADAATAEIHDLTVAIAGLNATVGTLSGEGVEEDLADVTLRLGAARATEAALRHEVEVLRALISALEAAQSAARDRYFAPVLAELRPMLRLLWPDAELRFDGDNLLPEALVRDGRDEAIGTLSGGTREQIALLVRLAFARLLAKSGRHAPVILDDALVYTDDERIESMFNALHAQAGDLQIIVLSCRNRAMRQLGGQKLRFEAVAAP